MISTTDFQESAAALEDFVARRRRESRIARFFYRIIDPFRVAFGLSRLYHGMNRLRDHVADILTPYLAGELSPDECAIVDQFLADDPLLMEVAAPMIAAWNASRGSDVMPAADVDAAWSRFQREIGARRPKRGEGV